MKKKVLSMMFATFVALGMLTAPTVPAEAAGCARPYVKMFSAYNHNCTWAKHYYYVTVNGKSKRRWGNTAGPRSWSRQKHGHTYPAAPGARTSNKRAYWV